jgi:hypothetical protein
MLSHHAAWLSAHPDRDEQWFADRIKDGFDVHHLDGNPENNDPANLALIEHADHMMLHGMTKTSALNRMTPWNKGRRGPRKPPVRSFRRTQRAAEKKIYVV